MWLFLFVNNMLAVNKKRSSFGKLYVNSARRNGKVSRNGVYLQILIDKQKKVIGTSLDETYISSDEEDTISNVLQQHEKNYCKAFW